MAHTIYITAGLAANDYNDSVVGDHVFYLTAGLTANDYTPAAATWRKIRDKNAGIDLLGDRVGGVF